MVDSIPDVLCNTENPGVSGANAQCSALQSVLIRLVLLSQKQLLCVFFPLKLKFILPESHI